MTRRGYAAISLIVFIILISGGYMFVGCNKNTIKTDPATKNQAADINQQILTELKGIHTDSSKIEKNTSENATTSKQVLESVNALKDCACAKPASSKAVAKPKPVRKPAPKAAANALAQTTPTAPSVAAATQTPAPVPQTIINNYYNPGQPAPVPSVEKKLESKEEEKKGKPVKKDEEKKNNLFTKVFHHCHCDDDYAPRWGQ
jgi:FtsZ-interacting cell division protein ZipA